MNIAVISGRLTKNAIVFGKEQQTLKFTVACTSGYNATTKEPRVEFVPCVLFRPAEKLRDLLLNDGKGKPVELRGRVVTSSYEKNGASQYATEVVVDPKEFWLARSGNGATGQRPQSGNVQGRPYQTMKGDRAYAEQTAGTDLSRLGTLDY